MYIAELKGEEAILYGLHLTLHISIGDSVYVQLCQSIHVT